MTLENLLYILKTDNETHVIEAKENFWDLSKIWETISALSNSASYNNKAFAYIIWWIEDTTWNIKGTNFNPRKEKRKAQDGWLYLESKLWFRNIIQDFEHYIDGKRIYVLEIKECGNQPVFFEKTPYIKINSHNQDLLKYQEIYKSIVTKYDDRSAKSCEWATIDDIDEKAFVLAKNWYIQKHYNTNEQMAKNVAWYDIMRFLEESSMLTWDKKITNSAIVLLWKKSARQKLPYSWMSFEIFWREIIHGVDQEFTIPFQLSIPEIVDKIAIKNIEIANKLMWVYTGNNTLLPNYSKENLRECVANCIAHQDYSKQKRITINETIHQQIIFENAGVCLYNIDEFNQIRTKRKTPDRYRNPFLVNAMREIWLMESKWSGHFKMFEYCKKVYLPLPEVDRSNQESFVMTIYGVSLDEKFIKILQTKTDLNPITILLLDQVQKWHSIDNKMFARLKKEWYVEWTPNKARLSFEFMQKIGQENEYINKTDREHWKILIYRKIEKTPLCQKKDILTYMNDKFPNNRDERKKNQEISIITTLLKKENFIQPIGAKKTTQRKTIKSMKI
jgi:ATP-dependent DNA helicase RecG